LSASSSAIYASPQNEDDEVERILEKAAEIRKHLSQLEGKTLIQLQQQREEIRRREQS
jgi:hypothetical protein